MMRRYILVVIIAVILFLMPGCNTKSKSKSEGNLSIETGEGLILDEGKAEERFSEKDLQPETDSFSETNLQPETDSISEKDLQPETDITNEKDLQPEAGGEENVEEMLTAIVSEMTLDEKISQMIIPAFRNWNGEGVTDLSKFPELKDALQRHQYGGVILYSSNISGIEQTACLLQDLQKNNFTIKDIKNHIPYFTTVDEEGGSVIRLDFGTRMSGNMAIGATGRNSVKNAELTGEIIGEELAALGFNVNYAPVVDVNNNPSNPIIGIRSFSDDPETVAVLGNAFAKGQMKYNIISTFKHFPGHGDTGKDSHIDTPSVEKTYDEIQKTELVPFRSAILSGADMLMTAHITYPMIDEEVVYGDGETVGYYPATMSKKIISGILRQDMGYEGIVVTDALEMDAIRTAGLVPGKKDSVEYSVGIAEKVINAGVDMLLLPLDMTEKSAVDFYDDYIKGISEKVLEGVIPEDEINKSVMRILRVKQKYGILNFDDSSSRNDHETDNDSLENGKSIQAVGSEKHHDSEREIAEQAVTLLKNKDNVLPIKNEVKKIFFLCKEECDVKTVRKAIDDLYMEGVISDTAQISFDYYYDSKAEDEKKLHFTNDMRQEIKTSDVLIILSSIGKIKDLKDGVAAYKGISKAMDASFEGNGRVILLSSNLPYDAGRFTGADAVVLSYLYEGLDIDPASGSAYNANIIAAVDVIFGKIKPCGKLPVNIPYIYEENDKLKYGENILFERGFGLSY